MDLDWRGDGEDLGEVGIGKNHNQNIIAECKPKLPVAYQLSPIGKTHANLVGRNAIPSVCTDDEGIDNGIENKNCKNQKYGKQKYKSSDIRTLLPAFS